MVSKRNRSRSSRAFITAEVILAMLLAALMAGLASKAVSDYVNALTANRAQRAVTWAADAQLQRYQAGAPLDSKPPSGVVNDEITLQTTQTPGQGQWAGFQCVTVTAETVGQGRIARAQLTGYVRQEASR